LTDRQKSVLLVEDSTTQRTILKHMLNKRGYDVIEARNGTEAEERLGDGPDAVLLCWELPDADGPELLQRWGEHSDHKWIPILMVTSHKEPERIYKALSCGATDFVQKPPNEVELSARLSSAMRIKELQDELRRLASRDPLTGLYNRRIFMERLKEEFARSMRYHTEFSVAIVDIDHFKRINDNHGHDIGDVILKQFAAHLVAVMRDSDTVARYGGEEFALLMPETSLPNACIGAERARSGAAMKDWGTADHPLKVTFSTGVSSVAVSKPATPEDLMKSADIALYEAKEGGRNRVVAATESMPQT